MHIFKKNNEITLNRVHDTVAFREGNDRLTLRVNADANRLVVGLSEAQKRLQTINEETSAEDRENIARFFSGVIFGEEQTQQLFDFYYNDASCVVMVCGRYFADRLGTLITKAQKKE